MLIVAGLPLEADCRADPVDIDADSEGILILLMVGPVEQRSQTVARDGTSHHLTLRYAPNPGNG